MKLILMPQPGLDQRGLVERAEGDGIDDPITRHFQRTVQIAKRRAAIRKRDIGKTNLLRRNGLAIVKRQPVNVCPVASRPVTGKGVTIGHRDLEAGLRLPHLEQMPVTDQQNVGLIENPILGEKLGDEFGPDAAGITRDDANTGFHSKLSCSSRDIKRFSMAVSIWSRMARDVAATSRSCKAAVMS